MHFFLWPFHLKKIIIAIPVKFAKMFANLYPTPEPDCFAGKLFLIHQNTTVLHNEKLYLQHAITDARGEITENYGTGKVLFDI